MILLLKLFLTHTYCYMTKWCYFIKLVFSLVVHSHYFQLRKARLRRSEELAGMGKLTTCERTPGHAQKVVAEMTPRGTVFH